MKVYETVLLPNSLVGVIILREEAERNIALKTTASRCNTASDFIRFIRDAIEQQQQQSR